MTKKVLFIILDGASDRPSAFSRAKMNNLNKLASKSECGLWTGPFSPEYNPRSMSSLATLELLGYSYKDEPGRGFLEALGIGLKPNKNSIYLRANFATVGRNNKIFDRRAGRDKKGLNELAKFLNNRISKILNVKIKLYRSVGHRNVLMLTGKGLSKNVSDGDIGKKPARIMAKNNSAKKTADILNAYIKVSHELLSQHLINKKRKTPANFLLLRAAGSQKKVKPFRKKYGFNACSVSGVGIIKGISRYLGIRDATPRLSENIESNLVKRMKLAEKLLKKYNFVLLHINGADIFGHDKKFNKKVGFLKKVDREVFSRIIKLKDIKIVVACDHITLSLSGAHVFGQTPILIYTYRTNNIKKFDEENCKKGFVTRNPMQKVIKCL